VRVWSIMACLLKLVKLLTVDVTTFLRKFYTAANSICSHTKYASGITKFSLVESSCLPLITYGCKALNFNSHIIHQLSVCWNNAYRRIFIRAYTTIVGSRLRPCSSIVVNWIFIMYMWNENLLFYEHCVNWTIWSFVRVFLCQMVTGMPWTFRCF